MKAIHFETVSRYDKQREPAKIAIPWKRGELWNEILQKGIITDGNKEYPSQKHITAFWDDGSIKWVLFYFQADLPANQPKKYQFILPNEPLYNEVMQLKQSHDNQDLSKEGVPEGIRLEQQADGSVRIINEEDEIILSPPNSTDIFTSLRMGGQDFGNDMVKGPMICGKDGSEFIIQIGEQGWEIVEPGPVYALLRTKGKHLNETVGRWMDYMLMIHIESGKPWLKIDYQIINCEDDPHATKREVMELTNTQAGLKYDRNYPLEQIREMKVMIKPTLTHEHTALNSEHGNKTMTHQILTSSFNYAADCGDKDKPLYKKITADTIVNTGNEMFPEVMFSVFTGDWKCEKQAFSAGIYQAYQNFPKAISTSLDGIELYLLPETDPFLELPQGVARTSRFYLFFHEPELSERMLVDRALMMEMPAVPTLEASVYKDSGVFEPFVQEKYCHKTERFLYRYLDSRAKGLGMLHFGDGPEWEYMKQGRSGGELIWINNEYDMPHNFMIMLARTGDRRYFDYLKATAEHWYDVDFCHFSNRPYRQGLLCTHSVNHVSGQMVPSHQWVEGLLDYYHLTGNPVGMETAMEIGSSLLNLMQLPLYKTTATVEPREIGWAMRTFVALYKETTDEKWLDACKGIVEVYLQWQKELGTWITPYPDNYMDRVPFMMHVGIAGMHQYYQLRPDERIRKALLAVIDDIIAECYSPRMDMFYGKQFAAVRYQNLNGMVLESLAIAYELTNEPHYIQKGLGMFEWITAENQPPVYDFSKYKQDEYTVIYNCPTGPKRCAQTLLPLLHYYHYALELGYLDC